MVGSAVAALGPRLLWRGVCPRSGGPEIRPDRGGDGSLAPGAPRSPPWPCAGARAGQRPFGVPAGAWACSQLSSVHGLCLALVGPCGQGRRAEPRTTHTPSWGLLWVRPRWRCYQGCWGPPPGAWPSALFPLRELAPPDSSASLEVLGLGAKCTAAAMSRRRTFCPSPRGSLARPGTLLASGPQEPNELSPLSTQASWM